MTGAVVAGRPFIVRYHAIADRSEHLALRPSEFGRQIEAFIAAGYRTIRLTELADAVRAGTVPERVLALTFDHAFRSAVQHAAPLLLERGLTATFFPVANEVGAESRGRAVADMAELAELASAGFEIGSHGLEHRAVGGDDDKLLAGELLASKQMLEQAAGGPVSSFALPFGVTPSPAARALLGGLYDAVCSNTPGYVHRWSHPLALPRLDGVLLRSPRLLRLALGGRVVLLAHAHRLWRRSDP